MTACLHLFNVFGLLTERSQLALVTALARRGHRITVACERLAPETPQDAARAFAIHTWPRIEVAPQGDIDAQMDALAQLPEHPANRQLTKEPFDLIHGHFGPRILHAAPWIARGQPVVISLYGYDTSRLLRDPAWVKRYLWAARHGAVFVALSQDMANRLIAQGMPAESLRLIRLGIDLAGHPFDPSPAPKPARFVFVGRFTDKKAPLDLLRATTLLVRKQEHAWARLEMVGSGEPETEQRLRTFVAEQKLDHLVHFRGTVPFERLPRILHGATALVLPSVVAPDGDREGAPMVLMHAQALGVPCITTAHAGNPEVLPGVPGVPGATMEPGFQHPDSKISMPVTGNPFVVPEHDPPALARAMAQMIELPPADRLALQHAGRNWIETHYDLARTVAQYDALYRTMGNA